MTSPLETRRITTWAPGPVYGCGCDPQPAQTARAAGQGIAALAGRAGQTRVVQGGQGGGQGFAWVQAGAGPRRGVSGGTTGNSPPGGAAAGARSPRRKPAPAQGPRPR